MKGLTVLANWKVEKLKSPSILRGLTFRIIAVAFGIFTAGLVLAAIGHDPLSMAWEALTHILGSSFGIQDFGILVTPLVMTGLAAMVSMRVNLWNVGGEGQFYIGALAASGVGIFFQGPPLVMLITMFFAGALAGALWIALPAYARVKANVDEIISTLLMNFVAILLVGYFASGPWRDPKQTQTASSLKILYSLPEFIGIWNVGIFIALAVVVLCWVGFTRTIWGVEVNYVGANRASAEYAGIRSDRRILLTLLISGAIAGAGGMIEVSGTVSRLQVGISSQFGYLGIVIAALAAGSFPGLILAAALMALLLNAGIVFELQGLSLSAVVTLTGWLLLVVGVSQAACGYRLVNSPKENEGARNGA